MVLFFAWTDIQLINCINTKCNYYSCDIADLVIDKRERISEELLSLAERNKIFDHIYFIELPKYVHRNKASKMWARIAWHMQYKKYFYDQICIMLKGGRYDVFLVAAFWGETLNLYRYIKKYNRDIHIEIVEEGMANYDAPKSWIYRTVPAFTIKSLIRGIFYCRNLGIVARRRVRCVYLYQPEVSWTHRNATVHRLPTIDEKNPVPYDIFQAWQREVVSVHYIKSKYIYIVDDPACNPDLYESLLSVLSDVPGEIRKVSILKKHPLDSEESSGGVTLNNVGAWVDNRKLPIENILFRCDIDQKVLVINRSSVLLYLKCMLNKEPWVILTYRIPSLRGKERIKRFMYFVEKMKNVYSNPDKIIIPNSVSELKSALVTIKNII